MIVGGQQEAAGAAGPLVDERQTGSSRSGVGSTHLTMEMEPKDPNQFAGREELACTPLGNTAAFGGAFPPSKPS